MPKGVEELPRARGDRRFRASIRKGKGNVVHLGLYEDPWQAGYAFVAAAKALGRDAPPLVPPKGSEPNADVIRAINARVRSRLGLDAGGRAHRPEPPPPDIDDLLTFFELTVLGFWRSQAVDDHGGHPGEALDAAAGRVVDAARLLFWNARLGHPDPVEAMGRLVSRRLDRAFGQPALTRELLDDDGDDPWRLARWLVHPDARSGGLRGFRDEVATLYAETIEAEIESDGDGPPDWASILGVSPPFTAQRIRAAYRERSRVAHPDGGGSDAAFVALRAALEEALRRCGG